jgi:hypothetical protein
VTKKDPKIPKEIRRDQEKTKRNPKNDQKVTKNGQPGQMIDEKKGILVTCIIMVLTSMITL